MKPVRFLSMLGIAVLGFALPFTAGATVKKEGSWPTVEKKVDLEFQGKPSAGLKELAKEANWSLVVSNGVAIDESGTGDVSVDVEHQPADAVLEALFVGRDVVAFRNGQLITIMPAPNAAAAVGGVSPPIPPIPPIAPLPPVPPIPPVAPLPPSAPLPATPPVPTVRGEDRNVFGGSLVVRKDEVVHTVTVAGGSLKVEGTITGDLVVAGGAAKITSTGRVVGNATVFGGSLKIEDKGRVDGDVGVAGGVLKRDKGAVIGGHVVDERDKGTAAAGVLKVKGKGSADDAVEDSDEHVSGRSRLSAAAHSFGHSMTKMALLFVLGCVLLALALPRMERVRLEVASRPMRAFALGLVGTLVGSIGALLMITILCVTVIGIPVAIVGVLVAVLTVYGAIASVLTTVGAAVAGHRTTNPYLHLLLGCAAFLLLSSIPWVGGVVTFAVTMVAIGALITTKVAGLLDRRKPTFMGLV